MAGQLISAPVGFILLHFLLFSVPTSATSHRRELLSQRPTFYDLNPSFAGKIALEEAVTTDIFNPSFTTPQYNLTSEIPYTSADYSADVAFRLRASSIDERVRQMDLANISISVVSLASPGIQGIFNTTLAVRNSALVNDQLHATYGNGGNYTTRFRFFCTAALQDPLAAASELERCVTQLGGVGALVNGYTNIGSVDNIRFLDDPAIEPFWAKLVALDIPLYLHPRQPLPSQQVVYRDYNFLAGSPYGFEADTAAQSLRLMTSGLFDRHPTLKIILGHMGEGLPFFIDRVDERLRHFRRGEVWPAQFSMRDYWVRNFWITTAGVMDTPVFDLTVRKSGYERVMFSVDYPYTDKVEMGAWFDSLDLPAQVREAVGAGNARAVLRI